MSGNENPFSFDKNGAAYQAARFRENFTIREFAEFLADCDPAKALNSDSWGNVYYDDPQYLEKVNPWIALFVDLVHEQQIRQTDNENELSDIPF